MKKARLFALVCASLFACSVSATTISETFATNPLENGWKVFGDTNLFQWDSTNQNLQVTWDSSKPNSYFYQPLGTILARDDDFTIEFDLHLIEAVSGTEPNKTGPMQLALGFLDLAGATNSNFSRASFGGAPNLAEFNYFPYGYYDFGGFVFEVPPTTTPAFISSSGFEYAPSFFQAYEFELPTNITVRVAMNYTAANQTLAMTLTTNGQTLAQFPDLVLSDPNNTTFTESSDFRVNTFSITSYAGSDFDSLLARGVVDNVLVTVPPPPVQNLTGAISNNVWQVQFANRTNWLYTLERTTDFQTWLEASAPAGGNGTDLFLTDTNAISDKAFYRVRADRP